MARPLTNAQRSQRARDRHTRGITVIQWLEVEQEIIDFLQAEMLLDPTVADNPDAIGTAIKNFIGVSIWQKYKRR
jgi:hypothetical protein